MYIGNPLLPKTISVDQALSKVKKVLQEKNWSNFEIGTPKLILVPYFYFNYHYYLEKNNKDEKIIDKSVDGFLAINANTLNVDEKITKLIKSSIKNLTSDPPELEFEELPINIEKKEQKIVTGLKVAEFFKIPKQSVLVSSIKKCFLQLYEINITIEDKIYKINANACIESNLIGVEKIPIREKGFVELTKEALSDLSTPAGWVTYSKGLLGEVTNEVLSTTKEVSKKTTEKIVITKKTDFKFDFTMFSNKWVLGLIIILGLFLIYLAFFAR
ncbi:MAG: hypothetical protein WC915_02605 [archaeon]|jgi:hypothetical protein